MRLMLTTLLTMAIALPAFAQTDVLRAGAAELFSFKTYWVTKPESCQPMISFKIRNTSTGNLGPIEFHMEVLDKDKDTVFARGLASIPLSDLPLDHTEEIIIGGDRDITPRECMGDMHEAAFSAIHFAIRLTATVRQASLSVEVVREEPMTKESIPAQN